MLAVRQVYEIFKWNPVLSAKICNILLLIRKFVIRRFVQNMIELL